MSFVRLNSGKLFYALLSTAFLLGPVSGGIAWADNYNPSYERGVSAMGRRDFDGAVQFFNEAIGTNYTYTDPLLKRGQCFYMLKNLPYAIIDFTKAIDAGMKSPEVYLWRGTCYAQTGKHNMAVHDYVKAMQLDPKLVEAYAKGTAIHDVEGSQFEGEDGLRSSSMNDGTGRMRRRREQPVKMQTNTESVACYEEAYHLLTRKQKADFRPGTAYSGLWLVSEDGRTFKQYTSAKEKESTLGTISAQGLTDPNIDDPNAQFFKIENAREKLSQLNLTIDSDPNASKNYFERARCYEQLNERSRAQTDFDRCLDLEPNNSTYRLGRAFFYHQIGKDDLALQDIQSAKQRDEELPSEVSFELADKAGQKNRNR